MRRNRHTGKEHDTMAYPYGDVSCRLIPFATPTGRLALAHDHYDHTAAHQDINAIYPAERRCELACEDAIGAVVDPTVAFMDYNPD